MDRQDFQEHVRRLRGQGKSIRHIATELGAHRSRVHRALKVIASAAKVEMSEPSSQGRLRESVFIGRQQEMLELGDALECAISGNGRLVMLVGQPGIGKTRTSREFAALAEKRGTKVLWGRCYEGQGAPPYWPWIQALRVSVRSEERDMLRSWVGAGCGNVAEILPELKDKLPEIEPSPAFEPEQARFRLYDSITTFLRNASMDHPLVLILDNLHWADRSSLLLLEFLSQELADTRILVIGTYRDEELFCEHPLALTLGELTKHPHFQRIRLRGLPHEDIRQLIELVSGKAQSEELARLVYRQTEGNPFFVTEVVRALAQEGTLTQEPVEGQEGIRLRIPEGVREVIGRRLHSLSGSCNQVLSVASVVGREFEPELITRLVPELSEERFLGVLGEALSASIIEEVSGSLGRYQFTHVLIQDFLYQQFSADRRARLHGEIGEALEGLYADDVESHTDELAYHFAEAELLFGSLKLVRYSLMAGQRALVTYAYEDAQTHFERAMVAKEGQGVDAETAAILFGLGRVQVATLPHSQGQEAVDTLRRAFDAFVTLGDTKLAVAAATQLHGFLPFSFGTADMIARALDIVPPDTVEAGYLLSRFGAALSLERHDYENALENLNLALEIARHEGDKVLEVRTLVHVAHVYWVQGHYRESVERFLPAIELAQSLDETGALAIAELWCAGAFLALGDGNAAQIHATVGLEAAERFHARTWLTRVQGENCRLAILRGKWKVAQEFIARALAELPNDALTLADSALLTLHIGNIEKSRECIDQIVEIVSNDLLGPGLEHAYSAATIPMFARVTGYTELLDVAESSARKILTSPRPNRENDPARVGLALVAILRNDIESAEEQYSILESLRGTQLSAAICYDHLLGLLAQTMGNVENARTHFEDALTFCRKAGYRTELAWSLCDYAAVRQAQGEREKALALLDEALAISTELGMHLLTERANTLKEEAELKAVQLNAPAYPAGLTAREMEVLLFIAQGKTTREIASELVLSPRTVQRHTTNLYAKINVRNRAEATAFVLNEPAISIRTSPGK